MTWAEEEGLALASAVLECPCFPDGMLTPALREGVTSLSFPLFLRLQVWLTLRRKALITGLLDFFFYDS